MNIGIIGTGNIAKKIVKTIAKLNHHEIKIAAVSSRSLLKAQKFANKYHIQKYYGSYEELCRDTNIDVIYVATPHSEHFNNVSLALNNNKHVICEKPLAVNAILAKSLFSLSEGKHLILQEAFWTRFTPASKYLKELISSDILGEIIKINIDFGMYIKYVKRLSNPALGGGALLDIGVYPLNLILTLFDNVVLKDAKSIFLPSKVDCDDKILLQHENTVIDIHVTINKFLSNKMVIEGSRGKIIVNGINKIKSISIKINNGVNKKIQFTDLVNGYEYQFINLYQQIKYQRKTDMSKNDSLKLLSLLDEIRHKIILTYPFE